ncbi:MAG: DUF2062 domain-containing protein [Bacteroidia bacterium]
MAYSLSLNDVFSELNCCVIIPTYNNEKTLEKTITDTLQYTDKIIVVNDGSTDSTAAILEKYQGLITVVSLKKNAGKGIAIRTGFKTALEKSFQYAITIDSDGQHFPSDLDLFLQKIKEHPDSLIIGSRNMSTENVPGKSSFGNKFSNFWFWVETGLSMPDTQSGYRLYPIQKMKNIRFFTSRFEFEIEVLVKAAWEGIKIIPLAVQVYYPKKEERVSHFRPGKDFFRISLLNTYLVPLAFIWKRPRLFIKNLSFSRIKELLFHPEESNYKKAISVAVGIFFGIIPIWGYQLISAIATAYLFRLNKTIVIIAANISFPPVIPLILYASIRTGEFFLHKTSDFEFGNITLQSVKNNMGIYLTGASWLAVIASVSLGLLTFILLSIFRKK